MLSTNWKLSEPQAIRLAQGCDPAACECLLYKAHRRHVFSVCLGMLKNPADAEDLTQQIFLRVFRNIGTFRGDSGFSTWLHRVNVNSVLMHLRRKRPTEFIGESLDADKPNRPEPRDVDPGEQTNRTEIGNFAFVPEDSTNGLLGAIGWRIQRLPLSSKSVRAKTQHCGAKNRVLQYRRPPCHDFHRRAA